MLCKTLWEVEYRCGRWDYIDQSMDMNTHSVLTDFVCGDVLDVGCGTGNFVSNFDSTQYTTYTGIDLSHYAVARAKKLFDSKNIQFVQGDALSYSYGSQYDVIFAIEIAYYFYPDKHITFIDQYIDLLKENGKLILRIWNKTKFSALLDDLVNYPGSKNTEIIPLSEEAILVVLNK